MQSTTQFGFLGNAILLGPQSFGWALSQVSSVASDNLREVEDLVPPLLERLEKRGEDVSPAWAALENLRRIERGDLSRAHFAPLAAGLKRFSEKNYLSAADNVALELGASVSVVLEKDPEAVISESHASFEKYLGPYARPILEMEQINKISAPRTLAGDKQKEMILILKAHLGWSRWFLEEITEGKRPFPPEEVLNFFASVWMESFGIVDRHLASGDPEFRREFFWKNFYFARKHFPGEIFRRHLGRLGEAGSAAEISHSDSLLSQGVRRKLKSVGLMRSWSSSDAMDAEEEEYRAFLLSGVFPAATEAFFKVSDLARFLTDPDELEKGVTVFCRLKRYYPDAPHHWILKEVFQETKMSKKGIFEEFLGEMLSRHMATLPKEVFERFRGAIARDFPEALYYRRGLRREIDREAIKKAMKWRKGRDKTVMHIGIKGDDELALASLRRLGEGDKLVLVDNDPRVFFFHEQDPAIQKNLQSGRVIFESTDYKDGEEGLDFRKRYSGKVDRVYLLHVPGDPVPVLHDIMAPGGLVVYQQTDWARDSRYYYYEHPMFVRGDFERLAGYANGPAWFETETAKSMKSVGLRFSVGRRRI